MSKRNIQAVYPLSPMQQGMLFHSLYAPESGVYFEQLCCTLHGDLDEAAFERAWQRVVDRHAVLRTAFVWKKLDKTLQAVHKQVKLTLTRHDWRDLDSGEQDARLEAFLQADRAQGFDLARAPLIRLTLIRTAENTHKFLWSHHHILMDGWSLPALLKEVFGFYTAFSQGSDFYLEPPRPYRDYIAWLNKQDMAAAEDYWRRTLGDFTTPTPLVVDRPLESVAGLEERYDSAEVYLSAETTAALDSLARQHNLTLSTLVQGAWAALLNRYSGEDDVLFGATVSGRPPDLPDVELMVGLFINTLPVRVRVPFDTPVVDWLRDLQDQLAEMRQYEYSPLVQVQEWSDVPRGLTLFDSIMVFENYPVDASMRQATGGEGLQIKDVRIVEQTNYPLTVVSGPGKELPLKAAYDARRFDAGTVQRLLNHMGQLLSGIVENPTRPVSTLPLLTEDEREQMLVQWNDTAMPFSADRCAHELFEDQVARRPGAVALRFEDQSLTYAELDQQANQLAHYLQKLGVGPETLVGIFADRSLDMVLGVIGAIKAGGAYVSLDPSYPQDRLAFMLNDAQTPVLLTQSHLLERLPEHSAQVVCLDTDWAKIDRESVDKPASDVAPENLAYVIYTSGSTGRPKGVLLQHRGLCDLIEMQRQVMGIKPGLRVLQFAPSSFDASVWEMFMALGNGATLYLARQEELASPDSLHQLLRENEISVIALPPSMLAVLSPEGLETLQILVSAGESCIPEVAARWAPGRRFINGYGPTETTVAISLHTVKEVPAGTTNIPIGRPLPNTQAYILDAHERPVPIGVPGELCAGGVGLARGYLNRPDLTQERFIPNSFSADPGSRLYRTGDLVRYLPDGNMEFLGRIDHQVKVRGHRIELGEVEAVLGHHPDLRQAAVVAREVEGRPDQKHLVAYIVPEDGAVPNVGALRDFLKADLPTYMVPSIFVVLEALPLSPSGKVDRKALPAPEGERPDLGAAYVAPRTPVEEVLASMWARTLGVDRVGVHDDFFDLGGHSLLATRIVSHLRRTFEIEIPLRDLFETPTVVALAGHVEAALRAAAGVESPPIEPVTRDAETSLPLSFAQQRLWFLDQLAPGNLFYNIPMAVRLTGQLDVVALEQSVNEIVRRHEALRTTFGTESGKPVQIIAPEWVLDVPLDDLGHLPEDQREAEAQRLALKEARQPFDLADGPLLRARLIRLDEKDHVAVMTMHHIVSDGWSLEVIIRELVVLYQAFSQGQASPLPELAIQYADFTHWQRGWLQGEVLERHLDYWKKKLGGRPLMLDLPTDHPRPVMQSWSGATERFALPAELLEKLKALSREADATLFMTLLAAYQTLLYRYSGQDDISVGTAIANRNRAEIEGLIGFFVNTLVMRTDLSEEPDFYELLKRVRAMALEAYAHQDMPFETLVEVLQPGRDLSYTPLFQAAFALQNAPAKPISLPGLTLSVLEVDSGTAKFDLMLTLAEAPDGLLGAIEYNTDLFDPATIRRMVGHLTTLLGGVVADPEQSIATLPLVTEAEREQLLIEWNQSQMKTPTDHCVHELFEEQVADHPNNIALTLEGQSLTYAELDQRANQMAHYLRKLGVGPDTLVGISTERSIEMIVGILGTLKAGGVYLPLDPTYPQERLSFMMQDSRISILLTQDHLADHLPIQDLTVVRLDTDWETIAREPVDKPESGVTSENLAYVIYTSGSTGQPKGTMLRHRGLSNLTAAQREAFNIRAASKVLQFSPFSFDASVWETFMALANGATLCLARQDVLASGQEMARLLKDEGVTNVTLPPSVLAVMPDEELPELETVISAGEACTPELVTRWSSGRDFVNAYGPTETTVCASMHFCDPGADGAPPIGRPIANTRLYVLDKHLQPVPIGVPGELHVGGVSLARGYLHRPDLTEEKFIVDPFAPPAPLQGASPPPAGGNEGGPRLYKTGDLVRYRADGEIEFLGRVDHQVKVRGFRIELGEIESVLERHPDVADGVVVAHDVGRSPDDSAASPGDKQLVAYVVPVQTDGQAGIELASSDLRGFLRQTLPEYMVPSFFMFLDALPLSPSGKVDRKALPVPDGTRPDLAREYVAPRTSIEEELVKICVELLRVDRVGVLDSFFELGGHSLLATQFISHVRDTFGVEVSLRTLFERPTVAEIAESVESLQQTEQVKVEKIAELLEQVQGLSQEEALALLQQESVT